MRRSALRTSMALALCIAMTVSCCSCMGGEETVLTTRPKPTEVSTSKESKDTTVQTGDQTKESTTTEDTSESSFDYGFPKHDFENGVCRECGKNWPTCFYENICQCYGIEPDGKYHEMNVHVNDGSGPNTNLEIWSNGEGFFINYESTVKNDTSYGYTLRAYKDSFDDEGNLTFAVDFSISTHYNRLEDPKDPQIVLCTTYECKPEDLMKSYEDGTFFKGQEDFTVYYYTDSVNRKYYCPASHDNEMTLEEMFEGEDPITPEEFKSIYLGLYKTFLSYIDEDMVNFNLPLSGYGIKLDK
ncbi:MAG: hypothetical protein K5643_05745 [Saccharofermentans sp.]|nr:hypothetical protein [Saccharofermentans sp.]